MRCIITAVDRDRRSKHCDTYRRQRPVARRLAATDAAEWKDATERQAARHTQSSGELWSVAGRTDGQRASVHGTTSRQSSDRPTGSPLNPGPDQYAACLQRRRAILSPPFNQGRTGDAWYAPAERKLPKPVGPRPRRAAKTSQ